MGWGSQAGAAASLPQVPIFIPDGMSLCWATAVIEKEREDMATTTIAGAFELNLDDAHLDDFLPPFLSAGLTRQQAANRKAAGEIISRLHADVERALRDMQKAHSVAQRRSLLATAKKDVCDSHARVAAATHTLATARPTLTPPTLLLSGAQIGSRSVPLARQSTGSGGGSLTRRTASHDTPSPSVRPMRACPSVRKKSSLILRSKS